MASFDALPHRKDEIRAEARARRDHQADRAGHSLQICRRATELPQYQRAATVMLYLSFRSEVQTDPLLRAAWADGKRTVVPYCQGDRLELFVLHDLADLAAGTLGILEPRAELRELPQRQINADSIDLVVTPGLAFDPQCGRLGYGKGYYDRLLVEARQDALLLAVAFECQVFPEVPVLPYDVRVDAVLTQSNLYKRSGPRCQST